MPSAVRSFCSLVAHSFLLASLVFISKEQSFSQVPLGQERRLLAEIHIEQKARAFQLSVSNPQCQLVLMLQCEIWRRKAAWDIKNYRQNSSGKATSLLVAINEGWCVAILETRGSEACIASVCRSGLRWRKESKLMNAVFSDLLRGKKKREESDWRRTKAAFPFFSLCLLSLEKTDNRRMTQLCGWLIISHPFTSHTPPPLAESPLMSKEWINLCAWVSSPKNENYTMFYSPSSSGGQSTQIKYLSKSTDTYSKILLQ